MLSQKYLIVLLFALETEQGIRNLEVIKAHQLTADDPDYAIRDLYKSIDQEEFPSWTFNIQVMTFEQAEKFRWDPFDVTKVSVFVKYFPLINACIYLNYGILFNYRCGRMLIFH